MHELDGYRSAYFPLKRFEVLDRSTGRNEVIYAPQYWRDELSVRDRIWIVHPERNWRIQISFDVLRRLRDTTRQRDELIDSIVEDLEVGPLTRPVVATREGDGGLIETVCDTGDGFHVFRLFRLWSRDDVYFVGQIAFEFKADLADRPETLDLIELFRPQLMG